MPAILLFINWRLALSGRIGFLQLISVLFFLALILGALAWLDSIQSKKKLRDKTTTKNDA